MKLNILVQNVSLIEGMAGSMRVKNLIEPLIEKDKVTVSNLALAHTNEKDKIGKHGVVNNVNYLYIGYNNPLNLIEVYRFYKSGRSFIKAAYRKDTKNVVYNYGYPDIKNLIFILLAKSIGYKIIFDIVEDNRFIDKFSGLLGWLRMKSSLFLINRIQKLAHGTITISSHLEKRMLEVTQNKIPVKNIPITVNLKYFPLAPWTINPQALTIFYGGSFYLKKDGMEYLIDAFKQVAAQYPQSTLYLSGKTPVKADMDIIMEMISDTPQIKYLGYLSVDDYFKTLNQSDIFCMPRNNSQMAHTGFPFKLGEFLASGKAIIATNVGDVPLYLTNNENALLINPESVEEIYKAIIYFIEHPEDMKRMGLNARQTAEANFSSETLSEVCFNFLSSL